MEARRAEAAQQAQRGAVLAAACAQQQADQQQAGGSGARSGGGSGGGGSRRLFGIVGDGQSHWQPLVREAKGVMELAGLDTEWLLRDLLAYADAVYA